MNRLALLLCLPLSASALELVRGPYLQRVGPDEATVVFRTDEPCDGAITWGLPGEPGEPVALSTQQTEHVAELTGLSPSTTYTYEITCDGLRVAAGLDPANLWVRTAPPPSTEEPVRAWVVGDSGNGSFGQRNVRDAAVSHWGPDRPDLFLHLGDMAYGDGTDLEFTLFFYGIYQDQLSWVPTFPTIGNHEGGTSVSADEQGPYYEGYHLPRDGRLGGVPSGTEAWYSYDWANIHFVVLDSHQSSRATDGPMLTWLAEDLDATDQDWIVAYFHHPPYTKGSHDSDTETSHIEMRENALPILEAGGVDLVLGGHSHIYERSYLAHGGYETPTTDQAIVDWGDGRSDGDGPYVLEPGLAAGDGALFVVAGHGGASTSQDGVHPLMYFAEVEHGSVLMDVRANRLSLRNVRDDGEVTDRVTLIKGAGLDLAAPDGAEVYGAGDSVTVRWAAVEVAGDGVVEWSCDDGASWLAVGEADLLAGALTWTVPDIGTADGRVRVRHAEDAAVWDMSDARFRVDGDGACPVPEVPGDDDDSAADETSCGGCGGGAAMLPLILGVGLLPRRRRDDR